MSISDYDYMTSDAVPRESALVVLDLKECRWIDLTERVPIAVHCESAIITNADTFAFFGNCDNPYHERSTYLVPLT